MTFYCSKSNTITIGSSIFLAQFLPIWNTLFVCQFYVKFCFCINNEHQKVVSLLFGSSIASTIIGERLSSYMLRTIKRVIYPSGFVLPNLKLTLCLSMLWKILFRINNHHQNVLLILFGSRTDFNVIEKQTDIGVRRRKYGVPSFWLHCSQFETYSLSVNFTWNFSFCKKQNQKVFTLLLCSMIAHNNIEGSLFILIKTIHRGFCSSRCIPPNSEVAISLLFLKK